MIPRIVLCNKIDLFDQVVKSQSRNTINQNTSLQKQKSQEKRQAENEASDTEQEEKDMELESDEGEESEKSDEEIKDHEFYDGKKHLDMFGDIETEFKMKSFLKVKHEMLCEYLEISALTD